ncbi:methionine adenosyltransferase [Hydrogenimonas cancrithermarum]|uniref:Methionine adenosyltransferase n=1 Tax=Hydrogenimonas cancrithermarum TaxID=2993563 RepID=A0ABN6WT38_9BACT|nr:methionine adenosyltransferase [Hydrogenimonas cancrithermarum]BDY11939.1 methionine adenosyltransferase [Hydrogenimonas cancrithermarum]
MYLYTSESVSAGHPDKCADIIADTIVDRLLKLDREARVATEVFISGKHIIIGGEVKTNAPVSEDFYRLCALDALSEIGYPESGFDESQTLYPETAEIQVLVSRQSPDISIGVDKASGEIGAGDQGMMIGFATDETESFLPAALYYSRRLRDALYDYVRNHPDDFGVDIKTQVTIDYETKENFDANRPVKIAKIVAAVPHAAHLDIETVRRRVRSVIVKTLKEDPLFDEEACEFFINGTGRYVNHSPLADSGTTGRKTMADTYGGYAPIGGGSQSSKDYTKVDRSGLYAARWIAKHIVAAGLARKAIVEIAYVIGHAKPLSVTVDTLGTGREELKDEVLSEKIAEKFPLTPQWITETFGLDTPSPSTFLYADIAAKGQVGYDDYPWERLEMLEWFKALLSTAE